MRSSGKSARPPTPMTRVQAGSASRERGDVGRVGADQRRQVGAVDDEDLVGHPDADDAVGQVDEIVQLGRRDEEQLLGIGEQFALDRRPGDDAVGALRPGEQAVEVGLRGTLGVHLPAAGRPLRFQVRRAPARVAGEEPLPAAPDDPAVAERLGEGVVVPGDEGGLPLEQAADDRLVGPRVEGRGHAHALFGQFGLKLRVGDARLDDHHAVPPVDAQDLVHAAEIDHDRAGHARDGVAVEVGSAGAHRDQRRTGLVGPGHESLHLGFARRPDHQSWA